MAAITSFLDGDRVASSGAGDVNQRGRICRTNRCLLLSATAIPRYGARMLWLIVILLIGALSFVIFHKPHVNAMGAGWVPPEKRTPAQPKAVVTDASVERSQPRWTARTWSRPRTPSRAAW